MSEKKGGNWKELLLQEEKEKPTLQELVKKLEIGKAGNTGALAVKLRLMAFAYELGEDADTMEDIALTALELAYELQELLKKSNGSSSEKKISPASMAQEWVEGFSFFLSAVGVRENTMKIYVRAIKRVMKEKKMSGAPELQEVIEATVAEYSRKAQPTDKVTLAALKRFWDFCEDESGFVITVTHNGEESAVQRIYCRYEPAKAVFEEVVEDYMESADAVRMYDKIGNPLLERICK